jgi:hypothetical protein
MVFKDQSVPRYTNYVLTVKSGDFHFMSITYGLSDVGYTYGHTHIVLSGGSAPNNFF